MNSRVLIHKRHDKTNRLMESYILYDIEQLYLRSMTHHYHPCIEDDKKKKNNTNDNISTRLSFLWTRFRKDTKWHIYIYILYNTHISIQHT